jgi:hypothetical protein
MGNLLVNIRDQQFVLSEFFAVDVLSIVKSGCEASKFGERVPIEMAEESFTY